MITARRSLGPQMRRNVQLQRQSVSMSALRRMMAMAAAQQLLLRLPRVADPRLGQIGQTPAHWLD
jgi:hypothetical protein